MKSDNPYEAHFVNQAKGEGYSHLGGSLLGFQGARMQRGFGLGSLFRGFYLTALPFAKTGAKLLGTTLNTYWMSPSPTSSLLRPDKVILGEAKLSPILFCMATINWLLDEVKSNKCFIIIIPKKSVQLNKLFGRGLCLPK